MHYEQNQLYKFIKKIIKPYTLPIVYISLLGCWWGVYANLSPYLLKIIIDRLIIHKSSSYIYMPVLCYLILHGVTFLNYRIIEYIRLKYYPKIKKNIIIDMFSQLELQTIEFHKTNPAGSISCIINDMTASIEELLFIFDEIIITVTTLLLTVILMTTINIYFALLLSIWASIFIMLSCNISQKIYSISTLHAASYAGYNGMLLDIINNMSSVNLFNNFKHEINILKDSVDYMINKERDMLTKILQLRLTQDISITLLLCLLFMLLVIFYDRSAISIGDFALIIAVTTTILQMLKQLANKIIYIYKAIGRCNYAVTTLATHACSKRSYKDLQPKEGSLCFKKVSFSYSNSHKVFYKQSIKIAAKSKIGITGHSGAGKSSFINLILANYTPDSGIIIIDGQNISNINKSSINRSIAMVPQNTRLFHRNIYDNIKYGNITANKNQILVAAKNACCHEFIMQLPQQYNTIVGEHGVNLSSGQRQRIAIARALLRNKSILILDEATSSLDAITEQHIQNNLQEFTKNKTMLVISHKLSTLIDMDRILVFHQGKIVADGKHQELIKKSKHYIKLWYNKNNNP